MNRFSFPNEQANFYLSLVIYTKTTIENVADAKTADVETKTKAELEMRNAFQMLKLAESTMTKDAANLVASDADAVALINAVYKFNNETKAV